MVTINTLADLSGDLSDDEYRNEEAKSRSSQTEGPRSKKRKASSSARSTQKPADDSALSTATDISVADDPISPQLARAIDAAGLWELRDILKRVCRESLLAERVVEEQLLSGANKELRQLNEYESSSDEMTKRLREVRELLQGDKLDPISHGKSGRHEKSLNGDNSSAMSPSGQHDEVLLRVQSVNPTRDHRREGLQNIKKLLDTSQRGEAFYLYLLSREDIKGKNVFITLSAFLKRVTPAVLVARLNQEMVSYTTPGDQGDVLGLRPRDIDNAWANYKKEITARALDAWVKPVYTHAQLRALGLGWGTCGILEPGIFFRQVEPTFDDEGPYSRLLVLPENATSVAQRIAAKAEVRKLELREGRDLQDLEKGKANLEASLAYTRGTEPPQACANCARTFRPQGPFKRCVIIDGEFNEACTNCKYDDQGKICTLHRMNAKPTIPAKSRFAFTKPFPPKPPK